MAGVKWTVDKGAWAIFNEEQRGALDDMHSGSDRVAGLIGGALIDAQLLAALQLRMRGEDNSRAYTRATKEGFLDSYNARVQLGYLLQMYGKETREDLEKIGEIRNKFAHMLDRLSFVQPPISGLCAKISAPDRMTFPPDMFSQMGGKPAQPIRFSGMRDRFVASIQLLMAEIFHDKETHDPFSCRLTVFVPKAKPSQPPSSIGKYGRSSRRRPQNADRVQPKRHRPRPSSRE
jgi:hypothetical protein